MYGLDDERFEVQLRTLLKSVFNKLKKDNFESRGNFLPKDLFELG